MNANYSAKVPSRSVTWQTTNQGDSFVCDLAQGRSMDPMILFSFSSFTHAMAGNEENPRPSNEHKPELGG